MQRYQTVTHAAEFVCRDILQDGTEAGGSGRKELTLLLPAEFPLFVPVFELPFPMPFEDPAYMCRGFFDAALQPHWCLCIWQLLAASRLEGSIKHSLAPRSRQSSRLARAIL